MSGRTSIRFLVSWQEKGRWLLLRRLRESGLDAEVLSPEVPPAGLPRPLRRLMARLAYVLLPLRALLSCRDADIVASWNLPTGVVMGLLKRFLDPVVHLPRHLVRDFHIDLTKVGQPLYRLKLALLRAAMPGMDLVLTTSRREEGIYAEKFGYPRERILFFPDAPPSTLREQGKREELPTGGYVFAYGNSDRDFDLLLSIAGSLPVEVVILSQAFAPQVPVPDNVTLVGRYVGVEELVEMTLAASCCVLPLKDYDVAAGQNAMLEVMALGRPLVVAGNLATLEYAVDGETAVFFQAGDCDGLRRGILRVLDDRAGAEAMGRRARDRALGLIEGQVEQFLDILRALRGGSLAVAQSGRGPTGSAGVAAEGE